MPFDWTKISIKYEDALKSWKTTFGSEIIEAIMSIPDTATFIEFIYEAFNSSKVLLELPWLSNLLNVKNSFQFF